MAKQKTNSLGVTETKPEGEHFKFLDIPYEQIVINYTKNWRHNLNPKADLGVESMVDSIREKGGLETPPEINGDTMDLMRGYRRLTAAGILLNDPNTPEELKAKLRTVKVKAWYNISQQRETELRFDDGESKPLAKSEIMKSWFRLRSTFDVKTCKRLAYQSIARYTGNLKKANQAEQLRGVDRDNFLNTWFKGTIDQFLEYAILFGPKCQECLVMSELASERLPSPEEATKDADGNPTKNYKFFEREGYCHLDRTKIKAIWDICGPKEKVEALKNPDEMITEARIRLAEAEMLKLWRIEQNLDAPPAEAPKRMKDSDIESSVGLRKNEDLRKILGSVLGGNEAQKFREQVADIDKKWSNVDAVRNTAKTFLDRGFKKGASFSAREVCEMLQTFVYPKEDSAASLEKLLETQAKDLPAAK